MDRKRKSLTLIEKVAILRQFDSQSTLNQKSFAKSVGLAESSFRTLLKRKDKILTRASASGSKKKRIKAGKYEELEKVLYEWFCEVKARKMPVNGSIIIEKAKEIAEKIDCDFSPSYGWLDRFKNRYNVVYKQVSGDAVAVNIEEDANYWKANILPAILKDYAVSDIYNADELGLFFKLMPDKSLVLKEEKCHDGKHSKDRVTVLVCSNLDGSDKVKLLVVGKSRSPRCFKHVKSLPCDYEYQNQAWMTGDIFTQWIRNFDHNLGKKSRKIILFVDHCPAHPKVVQSLKNIRVEFLPPNSTSVLQPMDQGIIKVLKQHYRKRLAHRYLSSIDSGNQPSINLLDAINCISAAWDAVKQTTITNCFKKAGFQTSDKLENSDEPIDLRVEEDSTWHSMVEKLEQKGISLENYVNVDINLATSGERSTEEIIAGVTASKQGVVTNDSDEEAEDDPLPVPTLASVMEALGVVRRYTSARNDPFTQDIFHLVNATEDALIQQYVSVQETTVIDDYFMS